MCKVLLFVDMEFPRGRGDQMEKSWKFQGVGGGEYYEAPWKGKSWGVGGQTWKNPPWGGGGGYGYFLEPHNATNLKINVHRNLLMLLHTNFSKLLKTHKQIYQYCCQWTKAPRKLQL